MIDDEPNMHEVAALIARNMREDDANDPLLKKFQNSKMNNSIRQYQRTLHELLPFLAERHHVATLGLFGSRLHGTQREGSDLDILVTFSETPSLLKLIDLENYLSDQLGVSVDLVPRDSLKPHIGRRVLQEVIPV